MKHKEILTALELIMILSRGWTRCEDLAQVINFQDNTIEMPFYRCN